jgi:hypothetical protein
MAQGCIFHQERPSRNVRDAIDFVIAARYEDIAVPTLCRRSHAARHVKKKLGIVDTNTNAKAYGT